MAQGSGFFKGEKKKKKKADLGNVKFSSAPVFVLPKIISKGKREE